MSLADSQARYGGITRTFHWLTALLILVAWPLGLYAHALAEQIATTSGAAQAALVSRAAALFSVHKTLGVAVVLVSVLRIAWGLAQRRPGLLNGDRGPEALAAAAVHWLLYALLVLVPVTGWIHHAATQGFAPILWPLGQSLPFVPRSEGVSALFSALHWAFAWSLAAVLALHVAGALKHHMIDRDATLRRMLRGTSAEGSATQPGHALPAAAAVVVLLAVAATGLALRPQAGHDGPAAAQAPATETARTATATTAPAPAPATATDSGTGIDPAAWQVRDGRIFLAVTQFGNEVSGSFQDWQADITWDETAPPGPAGHVTVTIRVPSLTLGSVTDQALGADFLAADTHPVATFDAELVNLAQGGQRAEGTFTLRGETVPLSFPFTLDIDAGGTARASAGFTLDRRDFGVGASMEDESTVAFAVEGGFELTATRD